MDGGILQRFRDFREIHIPFPDHLLALLQLDPADVLAGRDLQVLMEQRRQIAGADLHRGRYRRHRQLIRHVQANVLLGTANDLIFSVQAGWQLLPPLHYFIEHSLRILLG